MFTEHSPSEILSLNFEKMTVYLTPIFWFNGRPFLHQKGYNDIIYLDCSVWTQLISYAKHKFEIWKLQTFVLHTKQAVRHICIIKKLCSHTTF